MAGRDVLETCETVRSQIAPYTAGKLAVGEAGRIAAHLAVCDACAKEAAFARILTTSAPRLPVPSAPPALFDQIARATYAAPPRRAFREVLLGYLAPAPARLALGTAFAVSLAALVVLPRLSQPDLTTPAVNPPVASRSSEMVPTAPDAIAPALPDTSKPNRVVTRRTMPKTSARVATPRPKPADVFAATGTPDGRPVQMAPIMGKETNTRRQVAKVQPSGTPSIVKKTSGNPGMRLAVNSSKPPKITAPRTSVENPAPTVAVNPVPAPAPVENPTPAEVTTPKNEPDMTRTTLVAEGPRVRESSRASFNLSGAGVARRVSGPLLASRKGSGIASGNGIVALVDAPVTVD